MTPYLAAGFAILIGLSTAFTINTESAGRRPSGSSRWRRGTRLDASHPSECFLLPLFPLRQTVRLPTEALTLNLYEDRYLALAEAVLATARPTACFGALYASDKPQIVRGGNGPIVPLLEEGDVGVAFVVTESSEDMVPTVGGELRRRIRLQAQGAARFQVEKVICNGFESVKDQENPPFIIVEARLHQDEPPDEDLTAKLAANSGRSYERLIHDLKASLGFVSMNEERLKAELDSFAIASTILEGSDVDKRLQTLRLQSLAARLKCLPEL